MSGQIDVLAVMNRACTALNDEGLFNPGDDLCKARAALVELIDKVDSALALGWSDTAARELRVARARIGGAK